LDDAQHDFKVTNSPTKQATPSLLPRVGRRLPSPPFADRHTNLDRDPLLSMPNGGRGEPCPTLRPCKKQ
jgi:hypothetical protein